MFARRAQAQSVDLRKENSSVATLCFCIWTISYNLAERFSGRRSYKTAPAPLVFRGDGRTNLCTLCAEKEVDFYLASTKRARDLARFYLYGKIF